MHSKTVPIYYKTHQYYIEELYGQIVLCPFYIFTGICGVPFIYMDTSDFQTNLASPGYPAYYEPNIDCLWKILGIDYLQLVTRILTLHLEDGFDFLTFGNGHDLSASSSIIVAVTGITKLRSLTANSTEMWIRMTTDSVVSFKGFQIQIEQTANSSSKCYCESVR